MGAGICQCYGYAGAVPKRQSGHSDWHEFARGNSQKLGRKSRIAYWLQAEIVAIATDLAEVVGGAIALQILFGIPLLVGALITGVVSMLLLTIYTASVAFRIFERVIVGVLLTIPIGF